MEKLKQNEFQCVICKNVFTKGLSEDEALEQLEREFPGTNHNNCDLVCDDCFNDHSDEFSEKYNKGLRYR